MPIQLYDACTWQTAYAESILVIGEGRNHPHDLVISNDEQSSCMKIGLPNVEYFLFNQIVESLLL